MSADRDLKDAFASLGRLAGENTPAFAQLTSRAALDAARWRRRRHLAATLVAIAAVPAFVALRTRGEPAVDYDRFTALTGLDLSEVTWEAPSDFLLAFPGRELLQSVPLIQIKAPTITPDNVRSSDSNDTKRRPRS